MFLRLGFINVIVGLGAIVTGALFFVILNWEHQHDTALMNYVGFLMSEYGYLPYRDMSEASMPVSMLFHYLVNVFGLARDPQFLILGWLLTILVGLTASIALRPLAGRGQFMFAAIYVPLVIILGPESILQRDWLALLFIAPTMVLAFRQTPKPRPLRLFLIGALFGMIALLKPHLALAAPILVLADVAFNHRLNWASRRSVFRAAASATALSLSGFFVILLLAAAVLYRLGVWPDFVFLATEYLPTYIPRTFDHEYLLPGQRGSYILEHMFRLRPFQLLLTGAALLIFLMISRPPRSREGKIIIVSVLALCATYALVPAISGQFWEYHYLPFMFFAVVLFVPLLTADTVFGCSQPFTWAVRAIVFMVVLLFANSTVTKQVQLSPDLAKDGNVARYEAAIEKWLPEGGKIQPLAMAEGVYHAMLRQKVQVATSYLYDHVFYHDVGTQVNQKMRADFIGQLESALPELMLLAKLRDKVSGYGVSYRFDELSSFLQGNYEIVEDDDLVRVYLRNDLAD